MNPLLSQFIVVPVKLGAASSFNRTIFPLSSYGKRDSLGRGDFYLDATLDEMLKITNIGADPQQWQEFIATTKDRYDQLMLQKAALEQRPKSKNLVKIYGNYRAARMFLAASKSLYDITRSRSDEVLRSVRRSWMSVSGEDVQPVNDEPPPDEDLEGIVVRLDRPLDETTSRHLLDAANTLASYSGTFQGDQATFDANSILSDEYFLASESLTTLISSAIEETPDVTTPPISASPTIISESLASLGSSATEETSDMTTPPTSLSPTIITNNYNFYGSIYSPNSSLTGGTAQFGGDHNSGSVNHTITRPNTT